MRVLKACAVVALLAVTDARMLRSAMEGGKDPKESTDLVPKQDYKDFHNPQISQKWDNMEQFLDIMFTIACRWKHNKDVHGFSRAEMKAKQLSSDDFFKVMKKQQVHNVVELKQSCGKVEAVGLKKCRMSCQTQWGSKMVPRDRCDGVCVAQWAKFEATCATKAADLQSVYKTAREAMQMQQKCYGSYCPDVPEIYTMQKEEEQTAKVEESCGVQCEESRLKDRCTLDFMAERRLARNKVDQTCLKESNMGACMDKATADAKTADGKCTAGKATCGTQFDTCMTKGTKQGEGFCKDRRNMCETQVRNSCTAAFKKALDSGKKQCDSTSGEEYKKCTSEGIAKAQEDHLTKCVKERAPTCDKTCKSKCKVAKMNECVKGVGGDVDPVQDYCKYMWDFLYSSSTVKAQSGHSDL